MLAGLAVAFLIPAEGVTEENFSVPAGFVRFDIPSRSQQLVGVPLDPFDASMESMLDDQLSTGDRVLLWDAAAQIYRGSEKTGAGWSGVAGRTVLPGDAFWVENGQATGQAFYVTGRVIMEPEIRLRFEPALNVYGYPYSTAWGGWLLGQGYWYDNAQGLPQDWVVERPYEGVPEPSSASPRIQRVSIAREGVAVSIATEGLQGSGVSVLYQDLTPTGVFETTKGWAVAEARLPVADDRTEWVDVGAPDRRPPGSVFCRIYRVAAAQASSVEDESANAPAPSQDVELGVLSLGDAQGMESMTAFDGEASMAQQGIDAGGSGTNETAGLFIVYCVRPTIFVDAKQGRDEFSGSRAIRFAADGPKKTIRAGMDLEPGALVVFEGNYGEDLNIAGKDTEVRIAGSVHLAGSGRAPVQRAASPLVTTNAQGVVERTRP